VRSGSVAVRGGVQSLAVASKEQTLILGRLGVDLTLVQSGYGFMIGPARLTLDSFAVLGAAETMTAGPFFVQADSSVHDTRLDAAITLRIDNLPLPFADMGAGGDGAAEVVMRIENVDADALGDFKRSVDAARDADYAQLDAIDVEGKLKRLLASGLTLHFDQFDIAGPLGQITARFSAALAATDADDFNWAAALLALDASADISLPAALVDMATQSNPEMLAAIGMGFLQKKGNYYVLQAAFKQGLLNVNGAPMPIPLTGFD
jgi:hypothetical protein